jgi:hypothetical protein
MKLRIVTYVGTVELTGKSEGGLTLGFPSPAQSDSSMATSIDLAQGDITNYVPKWFWEADQQNILAFHQAQVKEGRDIIERNIRMVAELGKQLLALAPKAS